MNRFHRVFFIFGYSKKEYAKQNLKYGGMNVAEIGAIMTSTFNSWIKLSDHIFYKRG